MLIGAIASVSRPARLSLAVTAAICACSGAAAAPALGLKPVISGLSADPAVVASGASTIVTASVAGAESCTLVASKPVPGLPVTFPCASGTVEQTVAMPVDTGATNKTYTLTLKAFSATSSTYARVGVEVERATAGATTMQGLAVGGKMECAALAGGAVECWGSNEFGDLGNGEHEGPEFCSGGPCSTHPAPLADLSNARVAAGATHNCALLAGHIACWGENHVGQLGNGTRQESDSPVEAIGISDAVQVSAGTHETCALRANGHIDCWGLGAQGQLGNGTRTEFSAVPVEVLNMANAVQVAVGEDHACALLGNGVVKCWGQSHEGAGATSSSAPRKVEGLAYATRISAAFEDTCALHLSGHVDCWGDNLHGQLGNGTIGGFSDVPVEVSGVADAAQVAVGLGDACAVVTSGEVECWGWNGFSQLGKSAAGENSDVPVTVEGVTSADEVGAGGFTNCARLLTGHIACWGSNNEGQFGDGTSSSEHNGTPVEVQGISEAAR